MVTKVRSTVAVAVIWLATVAAVSATAWLAIDRAGRSITGIDVGSLRVPSPAAPAPTVAATPTPPPSSGSSSPSLTPSPDHHDRSLSLLGGQVSVRCTGTTIRLRIAQPANGWRVEVNESGPFEVELEFTRGEDESGGESRVSAVCNKGAPQFSLEDNG